MKKIFGLLIIIGLAFISHSVLAKYVQLPDKSYVEITDGLYAESAYCMAYEYYPEAFYHTPPNVICGGKVAADLTIDKRKTPPKAIPLPNGTWYSNPNNLSRKEIYCASFTENPQAWAGYEYSLNSFNCNSISNNAVNTYSNTTTSSTNDDALVDKASVIYKSLETVVYGAIFAGIFFIIANPKRKNTPKLYARWLACRFSFLLVWITAEEGIKYFRNPIDGNLFWGAILLTLMVYGIVFLITYIIKKSQSKNNTLNNIDNDVWQTALNEFESNNRDNGLWTRCFAEADGDEAKTKARYIKYRAEELKK